MELQEQTTSSDSPYCPVCGKPRKLSDVTYNSKYVKKILRKTCGDAYCVESLRSTAGMSRRKLFVGAKPIIPKVCITRHEGICKVCGKPAISDRAVLCQKHLDRNLHINKKIQNRVNTKIFQEQNSKKAYRRLKRKQASEWFENFIKDKETHEPK